MSTSEAPACLPKLNSIIAVLFGEKFGVTRGICQNRSRRASGACIQKSEFICKVLMTSLCQFKLDNIVKLAKSSNNWLNLQVYVMIFYSIELALIIEFTIANLGDTRFRAGNLGDTPRAGNLEDTLRAGNLGDTPRAGNLGDTPRAGNLGDTPRAGNQGDTPRAGNLGDTPRSGSLDLEDTLSSAQSWEPATWRIHSELI